MFHNLYVTYGIFQDITPSESPHKKRRAGLGISSISAVVNTDVKN